MYRFPLLALSIAAPLVLAGCATQSPYAAKSEFASVYTSNYDAVPIWRTARVFPSGLQRPALSTGKTHFIEFRARHALSYGHAAVAFGKLNANGDIPRKENGDLQAGEIEISGLAPASDSVTVYGFGHIVPVFGSTGPSDGDQEAAYLLSRYRINLTEAEFDRLVVIMAKHKRRALIWHGPLISCVTYLRRIAEDMGLKPPLMRHLPAKFVTNLKRVNEPKRVY